jgi:hypothetical protein
VKTDSRNWGAVDSKRQLRRAREERKLVYVKNCARCSGDHLFGQCPRESKKR